MRTIFASSRLGKSEGYASSDREITADDIFAAAGLLTDYWPRLSVLWYDDPIWTEQDIRNAKARAWYRERLHRRLPGRRRKQR